MNSTMLEKAEQNKGAFVFGLDIGTRNVVGTVGYMDDDGFHVTAEEIRQHKTRAMLDGQIHNINRVSEVIAEVKEALEARIEHPLTEVCIAAAGRVLVTETTKVEMEFNEETVVTNEDIHTLDLMGIDQAKNSLDEKQNRKYKFYCVGYSVVKYYLNDEQFGSLEGHKAEKIAEELIVTFLPEDVVDGLYSAVERAGLEVANLTLEPIAAMNVAIPENFRMLNIALVDVGAGTSDICITRDGSIIAYGMIGYAGDELTEVLVQNYLVDFATAEQIKIDSSTKEEVTFSDIMGISHTVPAEEVWKVLNDTREKITSAVAEKIIELNGDKTVAAAFVVGGGGKVHGFCESLSKKLDIISERVALRGEESMQNIIFEDSSIEKDPLIVTPLGICLNYFEQRNSFIIVHFNGEMLKIYDNGRLTIVDAALQAGLSTEELFPRRGAELNIIVNGISRMIRGEEGESAVVTMDGEPAALNTPLKRNSDITFYPSTVGSGAHALVGDLDEFTNDYISFIVNGKRISCPEFVEVNGILEPKDYELKDGDRVDTRNYYTVGQIVSFMDVELDPDGEIYVNNKSAGLDSLVYENFSVDLDTLNYASFGEENSKEALGQNEDSKHFEKEEDHESGEAESEENGEKDNDTKEQELIIKAESNDETLDNPGFIHVKINGDTYNLTGKKNYIFVDIFNVFDFDINESHGRTVYMTRNGNECGYADPIEDGDSIEIGWKEE